MSKITKTYHFRRRNCRRRHGKCCSSNHETNDEIICAKSNQTQCAMMKQLHKSIVISSTILNHSHQQSLCRAYRLTCNSACQTKNKKNKVNKVTQVTTYHIISHFKSNGKMKMKLKAQEKIAKTSNPNSFHIHHSNFYQQKYNRHRRNIIFIIMRGILLCKHHSIATTFKKRRGNMVQYASSLIK